MREKGHVKWGVVNYYIKSTGRPLSAALLTCLLGMQLSANAFTYWLSLWSSHTDDYTPRDFLIISGTIAALNSTFTLFRSFLFAYGGLRAARLLHDQLLRAVLGASMAFFNAHPVGRILNRFAQDTYTIDDSLPFMLNIFLAQAFGLLAPPCLSLERPGLARGSRRLSAPANLLPRLFSRAQAPGLHLPLSCIFSFQ